MTAQHPHHVPDARAKIAKLVHEPTAIRVLGHRASVVTLCEMTGVKRRTLLDQVAKSRIDPKFQRALATKLEFRLDWCEWRDGTALEFIERYCREHRATVQASERKADVRIAGGPRQKTVKSRIDGLASVEIQGHQFGRGTAAIELSISCGQPEVYGKGITIKSGRVELICYPAMLSKGSHRRWMKDDGKVVGNKGPVIIAFEAGTRDAPAWRLTAEGPSIGNIELDPDFAVLEDLSPGDEIVVILSTWLSDVEETDESDSEAISIVEPDGSKLSIPKERLSVAKQRIITHLRKRLLPSDNNGYVELARHTLRIVEAVNT
jgi:hypothetical protein